MEAGKLRKFYAFFSCHFVLPKEGWLDYFCVDQKSVISLQKTAFVLCFDWTEEFEFTEKQGFNIAKAWLLQLMCTTNWTNHFILCVPPRYWQSRSMLRNVCSICQLIAGTECSRETHKWVFPTKELTNRSPLTQCFFFSKNLILTASESYANGMKKWLEVSNNTTFCVCSVRTIHDKNPRLWMPPTAPRGGWSAIALFFISLFS